MVPPARRSIQQQIYEAVKMLNRRYNEEHNVTVLKVFDRYSRRIGSRNMVLRLYKMGILSPYYEDKPPESQTLWRVNIANVRKYLEENSKYYEEDHGQSVAISEEV